MKITTRLTGLLYLLLFPFLPAHAESAVPTTNKPLDSRELFRLEGETDLTRVHADQGAVLSIAPHNGAPAIKVDLPASSGYPGVTFPAPGEGWDLSDYAGVQVDLTNPGTKQVDMTLRIEHKGGADPASWSVEVFHIMPGKTETLKVRFGQSFGGQGVKVDRAHITAVRLYPNPPKAPFTVLLGKLRAFKSPTASPAPAAKPAPAPPAPKPVAGKPEPPPPPVFPVTPLLDISGKHDFPDGVSLNDDASAQLKGLCSLAEFRALPEADRHVYSFDPWPGAKDDLAQQNYSFNFLLGTEGVTSQKVAFMPSGGGAGSTHTLIRSKDAATSQCSLTGFGNLGWNGNLGHVFKFNKPVTAFGVVLKSSGDMELRRFFWQSANDLNGYPVSYTLADGTIVQLGQRELRGALLKSGSQAFIGVMDRSGTGIVSVSFMVKGLAGNTAQGINLCHLAFVTRPRPAVASVINLKSSCDFDSPENIAATPSPTLPGLASLEAFRFIVGNHRYVYRFDTWPQKEPAFGSNTGVFSFDLKGRGVVGQKMTVKASNAANDAKLAQSTLKDDESLPYRVLGGLGDIGKGAWAAQTFTFEKPVWAFGVTYRSPAEANLANKGGGRTHPVSYTLSDGSVINLGAPGKSGGAIAAKGKTFVGVIDNTDKGISSVTLHVQGTAAASQPVFIEDLAFAMAGPPPGDWKLTLSENFDGNQLDSRNWATGYKFVDVINNEMQGYVPENVSVANGVCTIRTEMRDCNNTDRNGRKGQAQKVASGAFTSYDKFTQTYGYFEARIKMPKARGAGVWPAFWMLPDRGREYPDDKRSSYRTKEHGTGIEIDIFEFMPRWQRPDGRFPVHVGCIWSYGKVTENDPAPHGYGGYALENDGWGPKELEFKNLDSEFHTYGLYWSPERLIWYLDGKPIFRAKDPKHVPDVPHYFLFNIAVHRNGWGKSPDKTDPTMEEIIADMPNQMEIDYFRAYSGTLEEVIPAAPSDIPRLVNKYKAPAKDAVNAPPAAAPAPAAPATGAPAAPANQGITSPSNG